MSTVQSLNLQLQVPVYKWCSTAVSSKENTVTAHSIFINSLDDGVECPLKFADHHRREEQFIRIPVGEVAWQKPKFNKVHHLGQKAKDQLGGKGPGLLLYEQVQ